MLHGHGNRHRHDNNGGNAATKIVSIATVQMQHLNLGGASALIGLLWITAMLEPTTASCYFCPCWVGGISFRPTILSADINGVNCSGINKYRSINIL